MNYVFLADGFEEIEAIAVIDVLRRAQMPVCAVSIKSSREVIGAHQVAVLADATIDEIDFESAEAEYLILPGGMPGAQNLFSCAKLTDMLVEHNANNRPLAAICAAPFVFGQLGILRGKHATCYPGFEKYLGDSYINKGVVSSENVVTAQGPAFAVDFGLQIVEQSKGVAVSRDIRRGMLAELSRLV